MIFDETKTITLSPEQARIHIAALVTHSKRLARKLNHDDEMIAEYMRNGDRELADDAMAKKQRRIHFIMETEDELERMRCIFGDYQNGTSKN